VHYAHITKQFINKILETTKQKTKDNDKNTLNTNKEDQTCIIEHEEPQITEHKQRKLSMKNETHETNFRKEMTLLFKI
jgi:hypothetical protein